MNSNHATRKVIVSALTATIGFMGTRALTAPSRAIKPTALIAPTGRGMEPPWWEAISRKDPKPRSSESSIETFIVPADVLFDTDSATIDPEGRAKLTEFAHDHLADASAIDIFGATDSTGTLAHNLVLSQLRADVAKAVLIDAGISPRIISTHGWADSHPIADEHGPDPMTARARNRRVELVVTLRTRRP